MLQIWNLIKSISDTKILSSKKANAWKPLGRLPMWLSKTGERSHVINCKRMNRYLVYMEKQLFKLHEKKEYDKIVIIWAILLKRSKSYQLCLFNRTMRNWYWNLDRKKAVQSLRSFMNQCRNWDMKMILERFYLLKPEGTRVPTEMVLTGDEKLRPIGSPNWNSRMISKSMNDLIYLILHKDLTSFQHAYRLERGVHTALIETWMRICVLGHTDVQEFDFKSYFNSISITWVLQYLNIKSRKLAEWVHIVYNKIEYKFDRDIRKLPREREIRVIGGPLKNKKYMMSRDGLPQGLSISPILATSVLKLLPKLEGLVMYADDGLIIRPEGMGKEDVDYWFECLKRMGIEVEPTKTGKVGTNFKFLGVEFDLEKREVKYKESTYSWRGKDVTRFETAQEIYMWFKLVGQVYGKKPEGWTWKIHPSSMLTKYGINLKLRRLIGDGRGYMEDLKEIFGSILHYKTYKGYRWFPGRGIYHITSSSTMCCNELAALQKDLSLVKVKGFNWEPEFKTNKAKYMERETLTLLTQYWEYEYFSTHDANMWEEMRKNWKPRWTNGYKVVEESKGITIRRIGTNRYKFRGKALKKN